MFQYNAGVNSINLKNVDETKLTPPKLSLHFTSSSLNTVKPCTLIHSTHYLDTRSVTVLPSCRASFMTDAPLGGSWLLADLKKGPTCRGTSSPWFSPSHIPLKSRTFSSSRDMISVSFCLNRSDQQRVTDSQGDGFQRGKLSPAFLFFSHWRSTCFSHLSSLWLYSPVVACHLLSRWGSLHPRLSPCQTKEKTKANIILKLAGPKVNKAEY